MSPLHVAEFAERVSDAVERVAGDSVNAFDSGKRQRVNNNLRDGLLTHYGLRSIVRL
jgi:hypothetical protein